MSLVIDSSITLAWFFEDDRTNRAHIAVRHAPLTLAERCRLSPYDAADLELAHRLRLPLATLDQAMRAAGRALRIALRPV